MYCMKQFWIKNKSNPSIQSQITQRVQGTNENAKQIYVADVQRGKKVCERPTNGSGFTSDWLKKWRQLFRSIVWRGNVKQDKCV